MKRVEVRIYGKVQGVFFRAFTKENADLLGIKGFVKNLPDGSVYALLEGEEGAIEKMIEKLKIGPPGARVDKIEIKEKEIEKEFKDFEIKYF